MHGRPWESHEPPIRIQDLGISHVRPWEDSSERVVNTTYVTHGTGESPIFTSNTVGHEVTAMHAPSTVPTSALSGACVHPSVHSGVQRMTDIVANVHVRPTVDTFGDVPSPRSAAQRSCGRSRSSD